MLRHSSYIFLGTPEFAATVLRILIEAGFPPLLVVCNPDRPAGRKKVILPPPAKRVAEEHAIPVWQPEKLEVRDWRLEVGRIGSADFAVVAAYNKIIPKEILDTLPDKFIGVHPSLLPQYRGASPIQSAILRGEETTGVTLFVVDEKVDHGAILAKSEIRISKSETYQSLCETLARIGGKLLVETLPRWLHGQFILTSQIHEQGTVTKKFTADDAFVDPIELQSALTGKHKSLAVKIDRMIRALNPEPGTWTRLDRENDGSTRFAWRGNSGWQFPMHKRIKLLESKISDGNLVLTKIQVEGKTPILFPVL